jgi:hypothetical protein
MEDWKKKTWSLAFLREQAQLAEELMHPDDKRVPMLNFLKYLASYPPMSSGRVVTRYRG